MVIRHADPTTTNIAVREIPVGTVFYVDLHHRRLLLRTAAGLVDLEDPYYTWTGRLDMTVENYLPMQVELLVQGPE